MFVEFYSDILEFFSFIKFNGENVNGYFIKLCIYIRDYAV
jgi:hypothetical protein